MDGIIIYEELLPREGNALPHSRFGFVINDGLPYPWETENAISEIERWSPEEIEKERGSLSWTQFAIKRCNHFAN